MKVRNHPSIILSSFDCQIPSEHHSINGRCSRTLLIAVITVTLKCSIMWSSIIALTLLSISFTHAFFLPKYRYGGRLSVLCMNEAEGGEATAVTTSALKLRLAADMKDAMKTKQKEKLATIRSIQAAIKQKEVDERVTLSDEDILLIMTKLVKQRKESIKSYTDNGRLDLAQAEEMELSFFSLYMPEQMKEEDVLKLIEESIAKLGATTIKDMGKVMADIKPLVAGKADAAMVGQLLKQRLSGKK